MKLAVFTPGAYVWPVQRNFETYIASLGESAALRESSARGDAPRPAIPPALDARLSQLHRDIYDALLRPSDFFRGETCSFGEYFWPELQRTSIDDLFSATMFFFLHRPGTALGVVEGLSVLRAVFFNHEASEPQHWVHSSLRRLSAERREGPRFAAHFTAPPGARIEDLAFVICTDPQRPPTSGAWITGRARREEDGLCHVHCECGLDPSLGERELSSAESSIIELELRSAVSDAFGWKVGALH